MNLEYLDPRPPDWAQGWISGDERDPLHQPCAAPVEWTTVNLAEAFAVVPTPMTYCLCASTFDYGLRQAFFRIGALRRDELALSPVGSDRMIGICFGRVAGNLDLLRTLANRMPGTSAADLEAVYFGDTTSDADSTPIRSRYPDFLMKAPIAGPRARRQLLTIHAGSHRWWQESLATPLDSLQDALRLLYLAQRRFSMTFIPHTIVSMLALGFYGPLRALAESIGRPGLESAALHTGGTDESRTVADLWALSRGELDLARFLSVHGFHGPDEGELASMTWREDDRPVRSLIETYRGLDEDASPVEAERRHAAERDTATRELLAAVGPAQRVRVRVLLRLARRYVPLREIGRDAFLKAIDVARFAVRAAGHHLHDAGLIEEPGDVFYLRPEELADLPADARDLISFRQKQREHYRCLEIPERWHGTPEPLPVTSASSDAVLEGRGVSSGTVEGVVRVITEQGSEDLEPEEILVCHTTDPSWAAYFFIAAGVIIDIGGPLSHGAIVARELGIPCVINATQATRTLLTGDRVRINGATGRIDILRRTTACSLQQRRDASMSDLDGRVAVPATHRDPPTQPSKRWPTFALTLTSPDSAGITSAVISVDGGSAPTEQTPRRVGEAAAHHTASQVGSTDNREA